MATDNPTKGITVDPDFPPAAKLMIEAFQVSAGPHEPEDVLQAAMNIAALVLGRYAKMEGLSRNQTTRFVDDNLAEVKRCVSNNINRKPKPTDLPLKGSN